MCIKLPKSFPFSFKEAIPNGFYSIKMKNGGETNRKQKMELINHVLHLLGNTGCSNASWGI